MLAHLGKKLVVLCLLLTAHGLLLLLGGRFLAALSNCCQPSPVLAIQALLRVLVLPHALRAFPLSGGTTLPTTVPAATALRAFARYAGAQAARQTQAGSAPMTRRHPVCLEVLTAASTAHVDLTRSVRTVHESTTGRGCSVDPLADRAARPASHTAGSRGWPSCSSCGCFVKQVPLSLFLALSFYTLRTPPQSDMLLDTAR